MEKTYQILPSKDGDGAEEGQADDHGMARPAARVPRLKVAVPAEPGVVVVVGLQMQCKYSVQGSAKRRGLGCVNFLPGCAWL